ncbi:MAG: hypothetical protein Tsb006_0600 [Rickettsiaceae bacterium]
MQNWGLMKKYEMNFWDKNKEPLRVFIPQIRKNREKVFFCVSKNNFFMKDYLGELVCHIGAFTKILALIN